MDFVTNYGLTSRPIDQLVQAPIESPLNMAHTFSRKAEVLSRRNNFEEAISCHAKAAECILQAMASCTSQTLLESLQIQHKAYLSQMARLSAKAQLLTQVEGTLSPSFTISRATQTDSVHNMKTDEPLKMNEDFIYQIIRENDDMISSVIQKPAEKQNDENKKPPSLVKSPSDSACCDKNQSGWKFVQDTSFLRNKNEVKLEDVLLMNERLGQCVKGLLQELSSTHAEKKKIEERLSGSGDSLTESHSSLHFSSLNLPPLENFYPEVGHFSPQT